MKNLRSRFSKQLIHLVTRVLILLVPFGFFGRAAYSQITSTIPASRCGEGPLILRATAATGIIKWYDVPFYGTPLGTGTTFTTPSLVVTKTYYADAVDGSNCSLNIGNARVQVIAGISVNTIQSVIFYSSNSFCKSVVGSQDITRSGTAGGVFSVNPLTGLSINLSTGSIIPSTSTTGTYTVTYTVVAAEGCSENPASTTITISDVPSAPEISYSGSIYCTTASPVLVNQTGAGSGIYSASPSGLTINASTGTITPSTSQAGNYTVKYFVPGAGGCAPQSATASVSINTASVGGTAAPANSPISAGIGTTISLTGYNGTIQWQSGIDNSTFNNISGQTTGTLSTGNLSATTYYRAIVTNGICSLATSSTATVVVNAVSVAGTATGAQNICLGYTAGLALTGYIGTIQWQTNATGSFVDINGATSSSYNTPTLTTTTSYRAVVTNGVSAPATSNLVQITVIPTSVGGSVNGTTICTGTSANLLLSEYTGTIQWQTNASGSWVDISSAIGAEYTTPYLTATTSYKAIVTNAPCSSVESTVAIVTVDPVSVGGTATAPLTEICSGGATTITLSSYTGNIQWQSNASGSFADIKGETSTTYTTPALTSTTIYRAIVTNGVCGSSTSTEATVTVVADPSISEQLAPATSECIGGTVQLSVTAGNGTPLLTYQWYSNTTASETGSTLLTGATNPTYTPVTTDAGTTYYYVVVNAAGNGCTSITSDFAQVIVGAFPTITSDGIAATVTTSASEQTTTLAYTATSSTPVSYSIDWEALTDQTTTTNTFQSGDGSVAGIIIPASTAAGVYTGTITITTVNGCTATQAVSVSVAPAAPTGSPSQTFCSIDLKTLSDLTVTGTSIRWYNAISGGTEYTSPGTITLINGTTYYASQTLNGVESTTRLAVATTVTTTPAAPEADTQIASQTQIDWKWSAVSGATGYKWSTTNNYNNATDLGNVLIKTETGLTCGTGYTRYFWAYNTTACESGVTQLTQTTLSCSTFSVSGIDFANGSGGTAGMLDQNDQVIITFSQELNPSTINASLVKGGSISLTNGTDQIDFYVNTDWHLAGYLSGWNIGAFTEHGEVNNISTGTPHFNKISLDATGTILTLNLINASGSTFINASSSDYVGYTPSSNIKAADGSSITVTEIREPDGSTVF